MFDVKALDTFRRRIYPSIMARRPLAALILVFAAAFPAAADDLVVTKSRNAIAAAFTADVDLKTINLAALRERAATAADPSSALDLLALYEQAKYIQQGRETDRDSPELFFTMIRSVARRLSSDEDRAVAIYGNRRRLSPPDEIIRAAIFENISKSQPLSEARKKRITQLTHETSARLTDDRNDDGLVPRGASALVSHIVNRPDAAAPTKNNEVIFARIEKRIHNPPPEPNQPSALDQPIQQKDPPPATDKPYSWNDLAPYIDWDRGKVVAEEAFKGILGYKESELAVCWRYVKKAFAKAGIGSVPDTRAAKIFSDDVRRNPKILDGMGYRRIDLAHIGNDPATIPNGSLLIYQPVIKKVNSVKVPTGCGGRSPEFGHSELTVNEETYAELRANNSRLRRLKYITVNPNEIRVCSYYCAKRTMPYLRTYGKQGCLKMYVPVKPI